MSATYINSYTFQALLQEIEAKATSKVEAIHRRGEAQDTLIGDLGIKATEAVTLRKEIHDKDRELEKKNSELESKHALINALRRDVEGIGRLRGAIRTKDQDNARLVKEKQHAQQRAAKLTEEFKIFTAEREAARAELDARKSLIESLREDAERTQALEAQLKEKRDVISKLEGRIDRRVSTLAESQQSVTTWKEKFASLKSRNPSSESIIVPKLTEEELQAEESAEDISEELMPRPCLCLLCV